MMLKLTLILLCFFACDLVYGQPCNFIKISQGKAEAHLNNIFGIKFTKSNLKLNRRLSVVENEVGNHSTSLEDYNNSFLPSRILLIYDLIHNADTVHSIHFRYYDSIKTKESDLKIEGLAELLGWKMELEGRFRFNYRKLQSYLKRDSSFTFYENNISLRSEPVPDVIIKGGKVFIHTRFYWVVTSSKRIWDSVVGAFLIYTLYETHIDVATGKLIDRIDFPSTMVL